MTQRGRAFIRGRKERFLGIATILGALGFVGTGHAKPIKVWLYGDGESNRMLSELTPNGSPAPGYLLTSGLTVIGKAPMDSTGPDNPNVAPRINADFSAVPSSQWPDVVHIGYSASAMSYWYCATNPNWNNPNDPHYYLNVAWNEAVAIQQAATAVTNLAKTVLLTIGPGSPTPGWNGGLISNCMNEATDAVTYYVAYLTSNQYLYVDYSGLNPNSLGAGGVADPALKLDKSIKELWQTDNVHVSCDKAHFETGTEYSNLNCVTVTTQAQRQKLGAWRVAKTVLKAYQWFQNH